MAGLDFMDFDRMDDTGMYVWAAIVGIVTVGASYAVALWWQKWRDKKRQQG